MFRTLVLLCAISMPLLARFGLAAALQETHTPMAEQDTGSVADEPGRTRLYLNDGSFQVVLSYRVEGDNVLYRSAERAGAEEVIPLRLVDLNATRTWEQQQKAARSGAPAVEIDPELARQEAARKAEAPEIAPNLDLDPADAALVLDTYRGQPQLAILTQTEGGLNRRTAHNILRERINPMSAPHKLVQVPGQTAPVQLHVGDPEFYMRLDVDHDEVTQGGTFEVDTHDSADRKIESPSRDAQYVIERVDVRSDVRMVTTFSLRDLERGRRQGDIVETTTSILPGGHWLKVVPRETLTFGEYALIEIPPGRNNEVNSAVWDFGVNPTAGPNRDAIVPKVRRPPVLTPRRSAPE